MGSDPAAPKEAGIYLPLNLQALSSVRIAGLVAGDMTAATNALRATAAKADAALRIGDVQPLAAVTANGVRIINYVVAALGMVSVAALVLALSGLYAVMSFTVSRRTREIGIRVALGSPRSRVVVTILRRPLMQLAFGSVFGALLTVGVSRLMELTVGFSLGLIAVGPIIFARLSARVHRPGAAGTASGSDRGVAGGIGHSYLRHSARTNSSCRALPSSRVSGSGSKSLS